MERKIWDDTNGKLLTPKEAAEFLGTTVATLATWRSTGKVQIPHIKVGRSTRYVLKDLQKFIEDHRQGTTDQ